MAKLSQKVKGIMAQIDAIMTMIERHELSLDMFDNIDVAISPMALLLELLRHCGVSYDDIVEWLAKYIVEMTPVIEIALKGILLAQLKSNVDCNLDPRIPAYLREEVGGCTSNPFSLFNKEGNTGDASQQERGIEIDLSSIDYYGILNNSPMSDRSQYNYFGTKKYYTVEGIEEIFYSYGEISSACLENGIDTDKIVKKSEIDSIYELVRAKDMNAFLWFILHKAKFLNTKDINQLTSGGSPIVNNEKSVLTVIKGTNNLLEGDNTPSVGEVYGQMIGSNQCNVMAMCIKNAPYVEPSRDKKENSTPNTKLNGTTDAEISSEIVKQQSKVKSYEYVIVPMSNIWNGCNWYVNRSLYFDFWDKKERDYDKEFALFRLGMKAMNGVTTNKLVFTIKPSPNLIVPSITVDAKINRVESKSKLEIKYTGDAPWNFFRIVFDVNGKQDFWGKYSVVVGDKVSKGDAESEYTIYQIMKPNDLTQIVEGVHLYVNKKTREYKLVTEPNQDFRTALYECYPGFTVYEFNYDFIMGMRLFDPTVIVAQLINGLTNIRLGLGASVKTSTSMYKMRISEIVKNMLETNGYESTDCFFSFSNQQYDEMLRASELKRAQLYPFNDERYHAKHVSSEDVYSVLNEFDSKATLEENISVVNRAITNASATISEEALPEDKYNVELDFVTQGIEMLTSIFVESLLTPKLLMVFIINQKIMGTEGLENLDLEKLLDAFLGIIMGLINELIDIIIKKLLEFVMEKVEMLLEAAAKLLTLEQVDYYVRLLRQMLEQCAFALPQNPNLASTLDNVNYADIDENDKPITNEC